MTFFFQIQAFFLCLLAHGRLANGVDERNNSGSTDYVALFDKLEADFNSHELGCTDRSGPFDYYLWRRVGYGSNVNLMTIPWANAVVHGQTDLVLILTDETKPRSETLDVFQRVNCCAASNGAVVDGYFCIFEAMPHVCVFKTHQDWNRFMIERNISASERERALKHRGGHTFMGNVIRTLEGSGTDILTAKATLLDYMQSHWQPWVKRDVKKILDEPATAAVRDGPYLGIHVRRGDKLKAEATAHDVQEYLLKAKSYLENSTEDTVSVHDIKGIWVASDGENVASEVKNSFAEFFPNVEVERIVWISGRAVETTNIPSGKPIPTTMNSMQYGSYVLFFAELNMLSQANVFVGTFSSNVARMIVLMRESRGMLRSSSLSVDRETWGPDRRLAITGEKEITAFRK